VGAAKRLSVSPEGTKMAEQWEPMIRAPNHIHDWRSDCTREATLTGDLTARDVE
jgi:hypothetical protein